MCPPKKGGIWIKRSCFFRAQSVEDVGWWRGEETEGSRAAWALWQGEGLTGPGVGVSLKCVSAPGGVIRRQRERGRERGRERKKVAGEEVEKERTQKLNEQASCEKWNMKRLPAKWDTSTVQEVWGGWGKKKEKWRPLWEEDWQDDLKADCCCRVETAAPALTLLTVLGSNRRLENASKGDQMSSLLSEMTPRFNFKKAIPAEKKLIFTAGMCSSVRLITFPCFWALIWWITRGTDAQTVNQGQTQLLLLQVLCQQWRGVF